ncbi:MAG: MTAP family purine nucleoside phosphorylase [Methanotrichaceae archaeon]
MKSEIVVIGGVGIDLQGEDNKVETPYGKVKTRKVTLAGKDAIFISRHGDKHLPPNKVNYKALLCAAKMLGAVRVISTNTVGTMSWHSVGSFVIPHDFVEFTKCRSNTFFDESAVHVDLTQPYCPQLRTALKEAVKSVKLVPHDGIYVCTEGPHLETPAQIRMMRQFGDVVGMTGYPEVALARELELCYASICIVTNPAVGMRNGYMTATEIVDKMARSMDLLKEILTTTLLKIPKKRSCPCQHALSEARL